MDKSLPDDVLKGLRCPECNCGTLLVSSKGKFMRRCPSCGATVLCQQATTRAMGFVAGSDLRAARIAAHIWFDAIWKNKLKKSRYNAYSWLSLRMHLNKDITHIGMFDAASCLEAISICRRFIEGHAPHLLPELVASSRRYEHSIAALKEML